MMRNAFPSESRIVSRLWATLVARLKPRQPPDFLLHDPAASRPHDMDDPYFDEAVQRRVAAIIASSARKKM